MSKPALIDRLHALRESLYGSEHDEKRRVIEDAIARIEAADRMGRDIDDGAPEPNHPADCTLCAYRALVREQDGGEK